jgi:polyhydroxybutyrate depolymerase
MEVVLFMYLIPLLLMVTLGADPEHLSSGDHRREIEVDGRRRAYQIHIPPSYRVASSAPVVLVFHGLGADAKVMASFCGMNAKSDQAGFVTVYPYGTGVGILRAFNVGGLKGEMAHTLPDDVTFVRRMLDDLESVVHVDRKRVYASGMSNGAMMCYRLAAAMPDRLAAIAPVAGTMAVGVQPKQAVPVIHFHGTADRVVPYEGLPSDKIEHFDFLSVDETINAWVELNQCGKSPRVSYCANVADDGMRVKRLSYSTKEGESPVQLYVVEGGGHTWPGESPPPIILGRSTKDISANDLIWEFFQRHPLP